MAVTAKISPVTQIGAVSAIVGFTGLRGLGLMPSLLHPQDLAEQKRARRPPQGCSDSAKASSFLIFCMSVDFLKVRKVAFGEKGLFSMVLFHQWC